MLVVSFSEIVKVIRETGESQHILKKIAEKLKFTAAKKKSDHSIVFAIYLIMSSVPLIFSLFFLCSSSQELGKPRENQDIANDIAVSTLYECDSAVLPVSAGYFGTARIFRNHRHSCVIRSTPHHNR